MIKNMLIYDKYNLIPLKGCLLGTYHRGYKKLDEKFWRYINKVIDFYYKGIFHILIVRSLLPDMIRSPLPSCVTRCATEFTSSV